MLFPFQMKDVQAMHLKRAMRLERSHCCVELERTHCNNRNEEDHKEVILECTDETNKQEWLDTIQEHLKKIRTDFSFVRKFRWILEHNVDAFSVPNWSLWNVKELVLANKMYNVFWSLLTFPESGFHRILQSYQEIVTSQKSLAKFVKICLHLSDIMTPFTFTIFFMFYSGFEIFSFFLIFQFSFITQNGTIGR